MGVGIRDSLYTLCCTPWPFSVRRSKVSVKPALVRIGVVDPRRVSQEPRGESVDHHCVHVVRTHTVAQHVVPEPVGL